MKVDFRVDKIYKKINAVEETLNEILKSVHSLDKSSCSGQYNEKERQKNIQSFMESRNARILNEETPVEFGTKAKVILHLVPSSAFNSKNEKKLDMKEFHQEVSRLSPLGGSGYNFRYNYDGFLTYNQNSYTQAFRNGCIEAVSQSFFNIENKVFYITRFEDSIINKVSKYVKVLNDIGIDESISIYITLQGINGYSLSLPFDYFVEVYKIDQREIILSPVEINDLENFPLSMKSSFDILWNTGGLYESINYKSGNWEPKY